MRRHNRQTPQTCSHLKHTRELPPLALPPSSLVDDRHTYAHEIPYYRVGSSILGTTPLAPNAASPDEDVGTPTNTLAAKRAPRERRQALQRLTPHSLLALRLLPAQAALPQSLLLRHAPAL